MGEKVIRPISHDLISEVIKEIPVLPGRAEISMIIDGIPFPDSYTQKCSEDYINECTVHKIIPASRLIFDCNNRVLNMPYWIENKIYSWDNNELPNEERTRFISMLLDGGRIHKLSFNIEDWSQQRSGFMRFRDEVLDGILEKGYQVYDGILNFNERIPKVDRLEFNIHFDFGLRLDLSDSMGQIERSGLECWFDELYQKTRGQTSLVL